MARSNYVYVVHTTAGAVVAGFTVKHEVLQYLRRQSTWEHLQVTQTLDGAPRVQLGYPRRWSATQYMCIAGYSRPEPSNA